MRTSLSDNLRRNIEMTFIPLAMLFCGCVSCVTFNNSDSRQVNDNLALIIDQFEEEVKSDIIN
jgi:hypothetical protein